MSSTSFCVKCSSMEIIIYSDKGELVKQCKKCLVTTQIPDETVLFENKYETPKTNAHDNLAYRAVCKGLEILPNNNEIYKDLSYTPIEGIQKIEVASKTDV